MTQISININLDVTFDEETRTCAIKNQIVQVQTPEDLPPKMEHKLGVAEIRYGIFTLGAKSAIGKLLPKATDINVIYDNKSYPARTHTTTGGRIDRLSSLIKKFHVNTMLVFDYSVEKKELHVTIPTSSTKEKEER